MSLPPPPPNTCLHQVPQTFKPEKDTPFYKLMVPTVDTVRNQYVVTVLARARRHILLVGVTGTGKTAVMQSIMQSLPEQQYSTLLINFSAQTTSKKVQDIIEGKMEKKSKKSYAPPGGKRLVCCIEDLNMPAKDLFFSQPTLELLRLWIDQGFWYDREKQSKRQINDMQLLGTMTSGRQMINPRIQSKFSVINITFPHDAQVCSGGPTPGPLTQPRAPHTAQGPSHQPRAPHTAQGPSHSPGPLTQPRAPNTAQGPSHSPGPLTQPRAPHTSPGPLTQPRALHTTPGPSHNPRALHTAPGPCLRRVPHNPCCRWHPL